VTIGEAERLIRRFDYPVVDSAGASQEPLVSVLVQSFNHERYIVECVESVLAQKTEFPFEVVVGDDCSTDGTLSALRSLGSGAPNLRIRGFRENLGRRTGNGRINFYRNLTSARGKYLAVLSGDDYWTSDTKISTQVGRLRADPGLSGVFDNVMIDERGRQGRVLYTAGEREVPQLGIPPERFGREELMMRKWIHMSSFMFDAKAVPVFRRTEFFRFRWGDSYIPLAVSMFGDIAFLDVTSSAYRFYGEGVWSGMGESQRSVNHLVDVYLRAAHFGRGEEERKAGIAALRRLVSAHGFRFADFLAIATRPSQLLDYRAAKRTAASSKGKNR
jgi:glycosyltransferase involved in cell wall biosynthesis